MAHTPFELLSSEERWEALEVASTLKRKADAPLGKGRLVRVHVARPCAKSIQRGADLQGGGTSLAKAYLAIRRFWEDLDVTYDIRAIAPDLVEGAWEDVLPRSRSQERTRTREIRRRLAQWVETRALPAIEADLPGTDSSAWLRVCGDRVLVGYEPLFTSQDFVMPEVAVEFGARSAGGPREGRTVECDAAPYLPEVAFPQPAPSSCWQSAPPGRRRRLCTSSAASNKTGVSGSLGTGMTLSAWMMRDSAEKALPEQVLARSVARHKAMFVREKDATGGWIDYEAAVSGDLQLVPEGSFHEALADDYGGMVMDGMLLGDEESFEELMYRCADLQQRANGPQVRRI